VILISPSYLILYICVARFGIFSGASSPVDCALIGVDFGANSFATANGMIGMFSLVLGVVGLRFGGKIFDRTGNYQLMQRSPAWV